ncbi:MAG: hypothetical protein Q9217_002458 [Psora testacea]
MSNTGKQSSRASPPSPPHRSQPSSPPLAKKKKRHATVYDAVAGRISSQGFLPTHPRIPSTRDTPSSSTLPIPPDEVLFRSRRAPVRYEENDIYWADRHLRPDQRLPESDLLKALHTYTSDFYERMLGEEAQVSYESLDESALLALGVLMEEAVRGLLGGTGDLALVEEEEVEGVHVHENIGGMRQKSSENVRDGSGVEGSEAALSDEGGTTGKRRMRKKRKVRHDVDEVGQRTL